MKKWNYWQLFKTNVWWEDSHLQLDSWIVFYFKFGRFPGLQNLPRFLRTGMPILPVDLYKKFAGTDTKALVSIHALAALNIHLGGNKNHKLHLANILTIWLIKH